MSDKTIGVLVLALGGLAGYALLSKKAQSDLPLPPSLKGHPVLGHLLMLPSSNEQVGYRDIGNQLNSDIISFTVLGRVIIVLNSLHSAMDLLQKRGVIYSDRPELPMVTDERLSGWGKNTGWLPYGDRWKRQRVMSQEVLHPNAGEDLWPKMVKQARVSMQRLLHHPESATDEIQWMTATMLLSSIYGYDTKYPDDEQVKIVEIAFQGMCESAMPANFFVNTVPWLVNVPRWFPGTGWMRKADVFRARRDRAINEPFEFTKKQMDAHIAPPSMVRNLLTALDHKDTPKDKIDEEEDMIKWVAGTLYATGSDTLVATMKTFVLAMVLHPDIQKKAQQEIDTVLGGRLPEVHDREALPYLNAIIKETFRWRSSVPIGVPRKTRKEDVYRGYRIPKEAIVIMNTWAMSNDPNVYAEPDRFNPDRFLDPSLPSAPIFGIGRRECPGGTFAESTFFIMASTFLTVFNVSPTPGKPAPKPECTIGGLASHPLPFHSTVAPRSEERRQMIEKWIEL